MEKILVILSMMILEKNEEKIKKNIWMKIKTIKMIKIKKSVLLSC